jgi:Zn-dependent protease with chaperone function
MAMDEAAFADLVQELERDAAAEPNEYKFRVLAFALMGYGYLLGTLVLIVLVSLLLVLKLKILSIKLVIPLLVVIVAVLRALWVRTSPPQGIPLSQSEAPALLELVRSVQVQLKCPPIHTILATSDFNAAIVAVPQLGILGWHRNYLIVGLPLMQAMSADEWQAVLAHELGHLSGRHGWFGSWIYRLRATWGQLLPALEAHDSAVGRWLFHEFLGWYTPRFNAYTFVLARSHEYEADAAAVEVVGTAIAQRALLRVEIGARISQEFWMALRTQVSEQPEPPTDLFWQFRSALRTADPGMATTWLAESWARPTGYGDTHPALADRLKALGWKSETDAPPTVPPPLREPSAACTYLASFESKLESEYQERWARTVRDEWVASHSELVEARKVLTELDARLEGSLTIDEEWERIVRCMRLGQQDRASRLSESLLQREPDHAAAHFRLGSILLERGDHNGVLHIEKAMELAPDAIIPGCKLLIVFHDLLGNVEAVESYRARGLERERLEEEARKERSGMTSKVKLEPHGWSSHEIADLKGQLQGIPILGEAYLARRVVTVLPEIPCYVLFIRSRLEPWQRQDSETSRELSQAVQQVAFSTACDLYVLAGPLKPLRRRLAGMPGARLI